MTHESTSDDELRELRRHQIIDSIPEFSIVENQKENITPRRKGRSAAGLVSFGMNYEERQAQLQQGHDSFEKELEQIDELDDPLDVYVRYIDWTEEMYPQGHNQESDLIGLLQDATTRFQKSEQYKNDARYLRCWLKYTEMLEDPGEVFRLLSKENIGQMLALYYEKYAAYLESRGRLSEAEKVFSAGINREAQPLARLERSFRQFRSRLEGRRSAAPVNTAREQTRALEQTGQRTILGHKMDSRSSVSVPANVYNRMYPNASNNGNTGFGNNNSGSSTSTHPGTPKFSVYVDSPSSSSSASNPLPTFSVSSSSPSSSSSSTAITHASVISDARRRPENDPPVSKFTGTTIPQRPYKRPGPPKFQVYRDDDPQDDTTKSLANGTDDDMTTNGRSLGQSRPASNFSQLTIRFRRSRSSLIRSTDSSGREEYISACLECIRGDQDISFEELRARRRDVSMLAAMEGLPLSESRAIKEQEKERHMKEQDKKQKQTQSVEELTAETRAAMESIDAMLTKRRPTEMSLDEDDGIPWTKLPKQRKIVNENDPPTPCYTANNDMEPSQQRQDSFFSDDMGFAAGEMDEDFDELERDMAREAEEARKRTG